MTSNLKPAAVPVGNVALQAATSEAFFNGVLIVPVDPNTKRPYLTDWPNRGTREIPQLIAWWKQWPDAMIGVLTGPQSDTAAIEIDAKSGGLESWAQLVKEHGDIPETPTHYTPGGGMRFYFRWPQGVTIKSRASDIALGIDVRGGRATGECKGQAIIPPSIRADGKSYAWKAPHSSLDDRAELPAWLLFLAIFGRRDRERLAALGVDHKTLADVPPSEWQAVANEKLRPKRHETGEAIHDLNADDIAGVERYLRKAITDELQALSRVEVGRRDIEVNNAALKIHSLLKGADEIGFDTAATEDWAHVEFIVTAETLMPDAERADFAEDKWLRTEGVAEPRDLRHLLTRQIEPVTGAVTKFIAWPEASDEGKPRRNSAANVQALIETIGTELRYNEFTECIEIGAGHKFTDLEDRALSVLWSSACDHGLHYEVNALLRLLTVVASRNRHHPVRAYLESLKWDGQPRLDKWLSSYLGAVDDPLAQAFGRVTLLGAVRRILHPGCKFDYLLTLEGEQGTLKSSAVAVLGGEFAGDGLRIGLGSRETIEQTRGLWIIEIAELAGMQSREVEAIKDQLSRPVDRARLSYGRLTSIVPRQWVAIATTNNERYLRDATGNRRFLPVKVGRIDLEALKRDRDQLWAEAFVRAKDGESAVLPESLWAAAAEAQEARRVVSSIEDRLRDLLDGASGIVGKEDLWRALGRPEAATRTQSDANALTDTMKRLEWEPDKQRRPRGKPEPCYMKTVPGLSPEWLVLHDGKFVTEAERAANYNHNAF